MVAASKGFAAVLESALPVTDQLANCLRINMAFLVVAGEADLPTIQRHEIPRCQRYVTAP
jgi:hypothetical protein